MTFNASNLKTFIKQIFNLKLVLNCFYFAVIPAILFYVIALYGLRSSGFGVMEILRDPAQQTDASSFLGFLSNMGVWLWVSTAAICFFTVLTKTSKATNRYKELILMAGILSLTLAVDDFFMIHDRYINERVVYLAYAILAGVLLLRHYKLILDIDGFAFLMAGTFLALSIFTDLIQFRIPLEYHEVQVIEEGFKFLGAGTWLYFNSRVASRT